MQVYLTGPETERLTHRAMTPDDAQALFAFGGNAEVMRMTGEPPLESVEAARKAIESYADFDQVGYGRWACVLKSTGQIIGFNGLKYLADLDLVDVGYRFLPQYWGQGIATEASRASIQFGFKTLNLDAIYGFVLPGNAASIRVLEKSGLTFDTELEYDEVPALRFVIANPNPSRAENQSI